MDRAGFPPAGEINLGVYDDPYEGGFGVLNGLVYEAGGTSVIVTNRALLANRLRRSYSGSEVPFSMMEAARREFLVIGPCHRWRPRNPAHRSRSGWCG